MNPEGIIAVYILASQRNGTLYTGMTSDLARRAYEHRERALPGFTKRYRVHRLVWFGRFELVTAAMRRDHTTYAASAQARG